ncbi:hypothetical protein GCM10022223_32290 [Kineosporia mesophila]|uniref:Uncharacterized protein n=2 Tax=Kineosporia mesophila TaxID=566012 RepID=A0ABP6ZMT2_9ACTN
MPGMDVDVTGLTWWTDLAEDQREKYARYGIDASDAEELPPACVAFVETAQAWVRASLEDRAGLLGSLAHLEKESVAFGIPEDPKEQFHLWIYQSVKGWMLRPL